MPEKMREKKKDENLSYLRKHLTIHRVSRLIFGLERSSKLYTLRLLNYDSIYYSSTMKKRGENRYFKSGFGLCEREREREKHFMVTRVVAC